MAATIFSIGSMSAEPDKNLDFSCQLPQDMHEEFTKIADEEGITLDKLACRLLRKQLNRMKEKQEARKIRKKLEKRKNR
jgi:hypothetical protein